MEIDIEKEYPSEFEAVMPFKVKYANDKDSGMIICHIPMVNVFFQAKDMEEAKKRARIMMHSSIKFWEEENEKGTFKDVWKK